MNKKISKRVIDITNYIIDSNDTIRRTAKIFKVSKSTVHKDINERLLELDYEKYKIIKNIMNEHLQSRHIKGGEATKELFLRKRQVIL